MRFLLLNTDYPLFLEQMYRRHPDLSEATYAEQMEARNATFFGVGDAYARALRARGHEAHDLHVNNARLQAAWVNENGPRSVADRARARRLRLRRGIVPWVDRRPDQDWYLEVLAAQVAHHRPNVVLNHDPAWIAPEVLRAIVGDDTLLIGQHAATRLPWERCAAYDLFVSSWPPTLASLRRQSIRAEHLGLGFDPLVNEALGSIAQDIEASFVGSFSEVHKGRLEVIECLCRSIPGFQVFSPSVRSIAKRSPVHDCYGGSVFGLDMFRVLARSKVTVNHHGLPDPHANNMRLFEATGVGSLLVTDAKPDLDRYFDPSQELVTFRSELECIERIAALSPQRRAAVAGSGQRRTLRDHTWDGRIEDLLSLIS